MKWPGILPLSPTFEPGNHFLKTFSFQKTNEEKEEPNGKKSKNKANKKKTEQDENDEKDAEDDKNEEGEKEEAEGEDDEDEEEETNDKIEEIKKPKRKPVEDESSELETSRYGKLNNVYAIGLAKSGIPRSRKLQNLRGNF